MYRPPEMCDKYLKYAVNCQVDIWAIGCILYSLCFFKHPFQEMQKIGIINAHYFMPEEDYDRISNKMRDLIRILLVPDPVMRPTILQLKQIIDTWDTVKIQLTPGAMDIKRQQEEGITSGSNYGAGVQKKSQSFKMTMGDDLSYDDITRLQEKIKREQEEKSK